MDLLDWRLWTLNYEPNMEIETKFCKCLQTRASGIHRVCRRSAKVSQSNQILNQKEILEVSSIIQKKLSPRKIKQYAWDLTAS